LSRRIAAAGRADKPVITFRMTDVDDAADVFTMRLDETALKPATRTPQHDGAPDWGATK
jgi:hypothetical protein